MRLNDWDWRREQEEACRLFDFCGHTVIDNWHPWYEATDKVAEYCDNDVIATKSLFDHFQAEYGAKHLKIRRIQKWISTSLQTISRLLTSNVATL